MTLYKETEQSGGRSAISKQQGIILRGYKSLSSVLATELTTRPQLREELSTLVHNPQISYRGILNYFFYREDRDFQDAIDNPFVRAFEATPVCTDEEKALISRVRRVTASPEGPLPKDLAEFHEWIESRMPFMVRGLQYFVRHAAVIEPLTAEEARQKTVAGHKTWREVTNPTRWQEIISSATQAAHDAAAPLVFKEDVRTRIQEWFDRGLDYQTVTELLKGIGVETSPSRLKDAVRRYPDLHYTLREIKATQRKGFEAAAEQIFAVSRSRRTTTEILKNLGFSESQIKNTLDRQGFRERTDWNTPVEEEGRITTLDEMMLEFTTRGGFATTLEEYQTFKAHLKEKGIDTPMTANAYKVRRQRALKSLHTPTSTP